MYAALIQESGVMDVHNYPIHELDVRYWMESDGRVLLAYPLRWREMLAEWAWAVAVRQRLVVQSSHNENKFYLSENLLKKRGRPSKK